METDINLYVDGIKDKDKSYTLPTIPRIGEIVKFPDDTADRLRRLKVINAVYTLDTNVVDLYTTEF